MQVDANEKGPYDRHTNPFEQFRYGPPAPAAPVVVVDDGSEAEEIEKSTRNMIKMLDKYAEKTNDKDLLKESKKKI